jgi:ABC-type glutathione transport system ATPase component
MQALEVENISIDIATPDGSLQRIVEGVHLSLGEGEIFGLLGESGTGKTLLAHALCGLLRPPAFIRAGSRIRLAGETVFPGTWKGKRGKQVFLLFQSAATALNPYLTIGRQLAEVLDRKHAVHHSRTLLEKVGLHPDLLGFYPFQLSGGMQQRILIALALGLQPKVLIADEPTTGLDAVSELHILELLRRLQADGTAILFISHDIRAVSFLTGRTGVMFQGHLVESGATQQLIASPQHVYTRKLIEAFVLTAEDFKKKKVQ